MQVFFYPFKRLLTPLFIVFQQLMYFEEKKLTSLQSHLQEFIWKALDLLDTAASGICKVLLSLRGTHRAMQAEAAT